jgi:hypothetical protein
MSTSNPLFSGLPPPTWPGPSTPGRSTPTASPAASGSRDWFAQSTASARVFSVQSPALSSTDVDAWAHQLVNHLLNPAAD